MTSFVDWFEIQNDDLWTNYPSSYLISQEDQGNFLTLDSRLFPYALHFKNPETLESDETVFQFISPFTLSMVFGIKALDSNSTGYQGMNSSFTISMTTSTEKSSLFTTDDTVYPSVTLTTEFAVDSLTINGVQSAEAPSCGLSGEHLMEVSVAENNISVTVYNA